MTTVPAYEALLNDLAGAVKASPGCLGVETARTEGGKLVIFAWFRDRQAVLEWYHGAYHREIQRRFFPRLTQRPPLRAVPEDDRGPIMAIASLTLGAAPGFTESTLPISQIAIELYRPVTGGIFLGSRFAPDGVEAGDIRDLGTG